MISTQAARQLARDQLSSKLSRWATEPPEAPALTINLKVPTEQRVLADQRAAEEWVRDWNAATLSDGVHVDWETRTWRSIGRQLVPVRVVAQDADSVARLAGGDPARAWRALSTRVESLRELIAPSSELDSAVRRHASAVVGWEEARFQQVLDVVAWLRDNPVSGSRPRQLPIRGIDTKWLDSHRSVVEALHRAATGQDSLGLIDSDRLIRLRILDASLVTGDVLDLAAPTEQLQRLTIAPSVVFIFENLESVLAMPTWPGAVVLHGSGYAVNAVDVLPWVHRAPVIYWGDLDSHGFSILNRLRSHHPAVTSTLMDTATLLAHRDLWLGEPKPARGTYVHLTAAERSALQTLRDESDARLEQERIPWAHALEQLRRTAAELASAQTPSTITEGTES